MNWKEYLSGLRSRKQLASRLGELRQVPERDPASAARGRERFLAEAGNMRLESQRALEHTPTRAAIPARSFLTMGAFLHFRKALAAIFLAGIVFLGGSAATVFAAQNSLPTDRLYPVKTWSEDALLSMPGSSHRQLNLALAYTDRRLREISALQKAGEPIPADVNERFQREANITLVLLAKMDDADMSRAFDHTLLRAQAEIQALGGLMAGKPSDPVLLAVEARLQEQVLLIRMGKGNPGDFRLEVKRRNQNSNPGKGDQKNNGHPVDPPPPGGKGSASSTPGVGATDAAGPGTTDDQNPVSTPRLGNGTNHKP